MARISLKARMWRGEADLIFWRQRRMRKTSEAMKTAEKRRLVWRIGRGRASDARIRARLGYEVAEAVAEAPESLRRSSIQGLCIKRGGERSRKKGWFWIRWV